MEEKKGLAKEKKRLTLDYGENVRTIDEILRVDESFDLIKKVVTVGCDELTFYYVDGFVKDGVMSKMITYLLSLKGLGGSQDGAPEKTKKHQRSFSARGAAEGQAQAGSTSNCGAAEGQAQAGSTSNCGAAEEFAKAHIPYVESTFTNDVDLMIQLVLSGASLILGSTFGDCAVIADARTYPARETGEPEGDKVMRGARDGFVETLIFNTALIRRRVRDPALTMSYLTVGESSKTDVVVCYMKGRADLNYVRKLEDRIKAIKTDALTLGHESLAECLIRKKWYNPFPKIRYTERPDSAAAQLLEGSVLVICDNSPDVMVLPATIFDFMQETNDFYFPPLTGTYIRLVRYAVFALALYMVPLWLLLIDNPQFVPDWLSFIVPEEMGRVPILAQILIAEFIIDGLRMASLNTPNMLSNSLSVVGGLILGDFAVSIGWLIPEVILYMAFVAIANFTQRSYELGYAIKFMRILLTVLTAIFGLWGFVGGTALIFVLVATNRTVNGERKYLYPLFPFNLKAFLSLFVRVQKYDVGEKNK